MNAKILPTILCGGSGTRLWPASREAMPKQFIQLIEGGLSIFQLTATRVSASDVFLKPLVIANCDARFIVAAQLAAIGIEADIILEPQRRDSAAAVAVATVYAAARQPDAIVLVMAADHLIDDSEAFVSACRTAALAAASGSIMTLGIKPSRATSAYGYIQPGYALPGVPHAFKVEQFFEKPDAAAAQRYVDDGYLWNGGYFLFRPAIMIDELARHAPAVLEAARAALDRATADLDFVRLDRTAFQAAPTISIDYAVIERTDRLGVVPVTFAWSDVGSWGALWEVLERDPQGNALRGRVELVDTVNSLVHNEGDGLTAVLGLSDIVVVTAPDAVLVMPRSRSDGVKDLVLALRHRNHAEADAHRRVYRPWGWYQRVDLGPRFQVKRITVNPGGCLSLQKHFHRAEHWVVVHGTAEVTLDTQVSLVCENEAIYIPIGSAHRLTNPGRIALELIEIQVGSYTGEDDIVRIEDVYGR